MDSWPTREEGWEQALAMRVRAMLAETAERHALEVEWSDSDRLSLSCDWPQQAGLDFDLWFALSGDEITFGGDGWYADVFPLDNAEKLQLVRDSIDGLITGEARVLLYRALGRKRPYWTVLQLRSDGRWEGVSTGVGCAMPPIIRPSILRNGHPVQHRSLRPAWISAAFWSGLAVLLYRFLA